MNTSSENRRLSTSRGTRRLARCASAIVISVLLVGAMPAAARMTQSAPLGRANASPGQQDPTRIEPAIDQRPSTAVPHTSADSGEDRGSAPVIAPTSISMSDAHAAALPADPAPDKPSGAMPASIAHGVSLVTTANPAASGRFTYDLFRSGAFTTQKTFTWCTAASTQLMLNIALHRQDHSRASQQRYIRYEHQHDLYAPGQAKGSDPLGWASAVNHFEGSTDYTAASYLTFDGAIWDAARLLRRTGKPVGLEVMKGHHAWVMTGFSATADPSTTDDFSVTQVMVAGPLYPVQQKHGYDMAPDTALSIDSLRSFFQPYTDSLIPDNSWEGLYVTIEP